MKMIRDFGKEVIVIDGADGVGKTTQVAMLREKFPYLNYMKFPHYESDAGFYITKYLHGEMDDLFKGLPPMEIIKKISLLYTLDRVIWFNETYNPHGILICDRYTTSNIIHMAALGAKLNMSFDEIIDYIKWLDKLEHATLSIPRPNFVIYLDAPSEQLMANLNGTHQVLDKHENEELLKKVDDLKQRIIEYCGWHVVNCTDESGMRSPEDINNDISKIILSYFNTINDLKDSKELPV